MNTLFKGNTNNTKYLRSYKKKRKKERKEIDNVRGAPFEFELIKSQINILFYKCCKLYW